MISKIARMPKANVATKSPKKYSGKWNSIFCFSGPVVLTVFKFVLICAIRISPSLEENKPDEKHAEAYSNRHAENPKGGFSRMGRAILIILIALIYILVRVHQVLVCAQTGRSIRRITRD